MKGYGYQVSTGSVFLLAVPGIKSAQENALMAACLVLGMIASIAGMGIRYLSHRKDKSQINEIRREARGQAPPGRTQAA